MSTGLDLLRGLAATHRKGLVHRDIKPSNVFLREGKPILGDFGIAKGVDDADGDLTATGLAVGTPAYMSPEQRDGRELTAASDVYAMGMVLYEAATGVRWSARAQVADRDRWSGVPRRLAKILQRALRRDPKARWDNAAAFRAALLRYRRTSGPVATGAVISALTVAGALLFAVVRGTSSAPVVEHTDLAILPLEVGPGIPTELGQMFAQMAALDLEHGFREGGLAVTPASLSSLFWETVGASSDTAVSTALGPLRTRSVAYGRIELRDDSVVVSVNVVDSLGTLRRAERLAQSYAKRFQLISPLAHALVRIVAPHQATLYRGSDLFRDTLALKALIAGDYAFQREQWAVAEDWYRQVLAADSTFELAMWRLYNVQRWSREPFGVDLRAVYDRYRDEFSDLDRLFIEADLAETTAERLDIYRRAIALAPNDGYAWLLYGNELNSRGALVGLPLDSVIAALDSATARNPYLAPVWSTLTWTLIRTGQEARATAALERYKQLSAPETDAGFCFQCFLELAWTERFRPDMAEFARGEILSTPGGVAEMSRAFRFAPAFEIPRGLAEVAAGLSRYPDPEIRGGALVARGLALVALGRLGEAVAQFDSAAAELDDPEYRLQAAQWRVLPGAVGMPGVTEDQRERGRAMLAAMAGRAGTGRRAAWTLGVDAYAAGDTIAGNRWSDVEAGDPAGLRLRALLSAFHAAAGGDIGLALVRSARILPFHRSGELGDPFARAVLYLSRGRWLQASDRSGADESWRWYLNADLDGWPTGVPQEAEIDWAFGTFARLLRGQAAEAAGDNDRMCRMYSDVASRWRDATADFTQFVRDVEGALRSCTSTGGGP